MLIKQLADSSDVYATTNQFRRDLERAHGSIRILKRTGVGRDRRVKIFRDCRRDGKFLVPQEFKKNLAGRGRSRIDVNKIAVTGITRVMIDIDPKFGMA